ncbi:hypothetical protein 8F11_17 [uncultured Caudovirales phage]|uniref:Uncharacterized protein n=1 Tax=uncultured Caudovirales phage TaxID=2100421 RepID=A0A2H4IZL5_9CAUD|nr:hypothetical protein 8F11_17 [uncultured Caudovirales phage]
MLRFSLNTFAGTHPSLRYGYRQYNLSSELFAKLGDTNDTFRDMEVQADELYDFIFAHINEFQSDKDYVLALMENSDVTPHDVIAFLGKFKTIN